MGGQYGDLRKMGTSHKKSEKEVGKAGRMGSEAQRGEGLQEVGHVV